MLRILYYAITAWLAVYGIQSLLFAVLYLRHRSDHTEPVCVAEDAWPSVVVQLPVFNERHVVERLIDAAAALNYPSDRLEIQVLDDSTDDTTEIAEARAALHRAQGVNVQVLHRSDRSGFKAGALAYGLDRSCAEFMAIFDADFRPAPDFLRRVMPHFSEQPGIGAVQVRWAHLNEVYSPLTRVQSLMLDGHFVVEQTARNRSGLLMCFNGSGGVWRRNAIVAAGGWQSDTMTEDMDLSYRAQMAGWRMTYLPHVAAPAELPPQMEAFKQQQARWARGSMQCLRKLSWPIFRSRLPWRQKLMSVLHMTSYLTHPLALGLLIASLPIMWHPTPTPAFIAILGLAGLGPPLLFAIGQVATYQDWQRRVLYLPVVAIVGIGISAGITRAVFEGLTQRGGTFRRTPKFRIEGNTGTWNTSAYRLLPNRVVVVEMLLALYAAVTTCVAWIHGNYGAMPFLLAYAIGFGMVAWLGLFQGHHR